VAAPLGTAAAAALAGHNLLAVKGDAGRFLCIVAAAARPWAAVAGGGATVANHASEVEANLERILHGLKGNLSWDQILRSQF